ncbi:gamma-mobile-trio integrase GmtZ [Pseudoalteromonas rubra]|uniref:gamma-mobile-trio integrase GmtZ n=1 Tax=Pseudoalteromonas rubra TaxID=43658 RepID=UPI000F7728FD|nr:integrase family protein [Pseudoalteromonas rubra]
MSKPYSPNNGITEDITFQWLTDMYGDEYRTWAKLSNRWLARQHKGLSAKKNALNRFYKSFMVPLSLASNPLTFIDRSTPVPDFFEEAINPSKSYIDPVGKRQAITYNNYLQQFLTYVMEDLVGVEDDFGNLTIPHKYRNPFSIKRRTGLEVAETVRTPLPYKYIQELREIICPEKAESFKDWVWAQKAGDAISQGKYGGDWFEVTPTDIDYADPNCVWRERIIPKGKSYGGITLYKDKKVFELWCPVSAVALYLKLELPLRTAQVRWLDSGEADLWRYQNGSWVKNTGKLAPATKLDLSRYSIGRGVFRRVQSAEGDSSALFINTNKTSDILKDGLSKGYTVPWQHERVLKWLELLRNWQEKYNPIERPMQWSELKRKHLGDIKSKAQLEEMIPTCFLFRHRSSISEFDFQCPISDKEVARLWFKLLSELEQRCEQRREMLTDNSPIKFVKPSHGTFRNYISTYFPLHTLRVSLITSFALEGGVPIPVLSKLVAGHSRIIMTLYYTKIGQAYMKKVMSEAEDKLRLASEQQFKEFLINTEYNDLKLGAAFNDDSALRAVNAGSQVSWQVMDKGICPVGCQGCDNGGEQTAKLGNAPCSYGPTPRDFQGNVKNCVRCRWFITGPAFMPGLIAHFNNLSFEASEAGERHNTFEASLDALKKMKFSAMDANEPFTREADLKAAEFEYEREATKVDALMNDMHATYRLIAQSTQIMNSTNETKLQLLSESGFLDVTAQLEENSQLTQLEIVCRNATLYPYYDASKAVLKRGQAIDLMLRANGQDPLMLYLPDEDKLKVGNQIVLLIENRVGSFDKAIQFVESQSSLAEIGFPNAIGEYVKTELSKSANLIGYLNPYTTQGE